MNKYLIYGYQKPDGKMVYIGQTCNLKNRHYDHIKLDPFNVNAKEYNYPLSRGIRKYGEDYYKLIILEENISKEDIDKREKYWISFYDTYWNGYNQTKGGNVWGQQESIHDEVINKVIDLLTNTNLSYNEIKEQTGVSLTHIYNINTGQRRKQDNLVYPLRPKNQKGTRGIKFDRQEIEQISNEIKDTLHSFKSIAKKYHCSPRTISLINKGQRQCYKLEGWKYPIRTKKTWSYK